jgi:signal peptidase I
VEYNERRSGEAANMKPFVRELLITIGIAVIIFIAARQTIQTYEVFQTSMEPNFHEGQRVVVSKAAYFFSEPQRGDVIVFRSPEAPYEDYIKRVIGIPGDTVEIKNGFVYVDGVALNEPYIAQAPAYTMAPVTIPDGEFFVLGDNRNYSNDSHRGWLVPDANVHGKAWLSTWPPNLWGIIPHYALGDQIASASNAAN